MTAIRHGWWMVRCCRGCPEVAARIFLADHEPGQPDNHMPDRPFLQGQIGLDPTPPGEVWVMLEYCEASPADRALMERPLSLRTDVAAGRVARATTAPMARWKRERARRITEAEYEAQIRWLQWAAKNAPTHPDFLYRRAVRAEAIATPRFK